MMKWNEEYNGDGTYAEWDRGIGAMITRYTTAPPVYDGFGTIDLGIVAETDFWFGASKPIRKVEIQPLHLGWQENRYWSGNHPSWIELPPSAIIKRI